MICAIVDTASPFTSLDQQKKLIATGPGKMGPHVTASASASEPPNSSAAAAGAGGDLPEEMPGLPLPPPSVGSSSKAGSAPLTQPPLLQLVGDGSSSALAPPSILLHSPSLPPLAPFLLPQTAS